MPINVNPLSLLLEAIKAVPAVKWALGVIGIVSSIAIAKSLEIDLIIASFGTVVMLILMSLLLIFARLAKTKGRAFNGPVKFMMWGSVILGFASAGMLFSSVFFRWPVNLQHWLEKESSVYPQSNDSIVDTSWENALPISSTETHVPPLSQFLDSYYVDKDCEEHLILR